MKWAVHTTATEFTHTECDSWEAACGLAIRKALEEEVRVSVQDMDGRYINIQARYATDAP